jgi:hypothetical protein
MRNDGVFGGSAVYYQIRHKPEVLGEVACKIGTDPDTLRPPNPRHQELIHSEACAVWAENLKLLFPSARIMREHRFASDLAATQELLSDGNDYELRPDLLLLQEVGEELDRLSVAVEIERSRKSDTRIITKLEKYATETHLDGVIYFCETDMISERIRLLYKCKILDGARRVKHYADNFFLFSDVTSVTMNSEPLLRNAANQCVSLKRWMQYCEDNPRNTRRDTNFNIGAIGGPKIPTG